MPIKAVCIICGRVSDELSEDGGEAKLGINWRYVRVSRDQETQRWVFSADSPASIVVCPYCSVPGEPLNN